ncbi:hypothetical protein MG5_02385 [Candida albicans P57072]|nr:hypothetical protein MG5_02385 [Candida albicans P57072]
MQQFLRFILLLLSLISYTTFALTISTTKFAKRGSLPSSSSFDPHDAFEAAINSTWSIFWNDTNQGFSQSDPSCPNSQTSTPFQYSVVWSVAVAGMAIVQSRDISKTNQIITSLYKYQNSQGWFSATPRGGESFVDDNCQVLWVFIEAYELTNNTKYLTTANKLMELIQGQWSNEVGGVRWKVDGDYIASISTVEAALCAVKLYEQNKDDSLLSFAKKCLSWLDDNLLDKSDGFYYDGLNVNNKNKIDKGKLTYTVGVAISTYSYLYKYTNDEQYISNAITKANGTIKSTTFMRSNGYWNNDLKYLHLLFVGIVDLIIIMGDEKSDFSNDIMKQGEFIYKYDQLSEIGNYLDFTGVKQLYDQYVKQSGDNSSINYQFNGDDYCDGSNDSGQIKRSLMENASAAQIFYQLNRLE